MKEILEPLTLIPGVRFAALISTDGVPIALLEGIGAKNGGGKDETSDDMGEGFHVFAGLAAGWLGEVKRTVAPLSWESPRRIVLRAARGTLVMQEGHGAVLLAVLQPGSHHEELRVPMEGAAARMQRHLKSMSAEAEAVRVSHVESVPSLVPEHRPAADGTPTDSSADFLGGTGPGQTAPGSMSEVSGEN